MRIDIGTRKDNKMLGRQEVGFTIKEVTSTPSRAEIRKKIAASLNADEKRLIVDTLETQFGSREISGTARVYSSAEDLKKTELPFLITRNFGKEEKKEEPAKEAGGKKEAHVKEEGKEEKKEAKEEKK